MPISLARQVEENLAHWAEMRAEAGWPVDLDNLHTVLDGVFEFYRPTRLYLFGSMVKGNFSAHSDVDLLIVVPDDAEASRMKPQFVVNAQFQHALPLDAVVMRETQFAERKYWLNGLASEAATTGVLLSVD